ncbi:Gmad2 immunoglobulin-like domain-containing protein [Granulicoccus sp. GXG6511]|uniref:Gmad2 immunoglobulin-like domain-containing protein n=1 Tax=Granulicoccus sp. GXG6511 TaxID=3381351 RepID=UPI003D7C6F63
MMTIRAATVVAVMGGVVVAGCTPGGSSGPTPHPSPPSLAETATSAEPAAAESPARMSAAPSPGSASPTGAGQREALVYFLVDSPNGIRLAREARGVAGDTPARGAVEAMIDGPQDPDYVGPWNRSTRVLGISDNDGVVTVDLSGEARTANVGSPAAAAMKQQLIHTVTEQLGAEKRVQLHIDGAPAQELWGAVDWTSPEARGEWSETLLLVGIDSPAERASVSSPVVVTGQAAVFEATLPWRVLTPTGAIVQQGTAMTEQGMTMAPYRLEVVLSPGEYIIEVTEDDPSVGEAGPLDVDTRRITVR